MSEPVRARLAAIVEGILAYGVALCAASLADHALLGETSAHVARATVRLLAVAAIFPLGYSKRLHFTWHARGVHGLARAPDAATLALCTASCLLSASLTVAARGAGVDPLACMNAGDTILGAAFEEILFRAIVGTVVLHRSEGDAPLAAAVSAILFFLGHIGGAAVPPLVSVLQHALVASAGMALSLSFVLSGSLVGPVALHTLNNVAALVWLAVANGGTCGPDTGTHAATAQLLVLQVVAYCCAACVQAWGLLQLTRVRGGDALRERHCLAFGGIDAVKSE